MRSANKIMFDVITEEHTLCPESFEDIVREHNALDVKQGNRVRKLDVDATANTLREYLEEHLIDDEIEELNDILDWGLQHYGVTMEEYNSVTFENVDWHVLAKQLIQFYLAD